MLTFNLDLSVLRKDIENSGVTWEEALLLMNDRKEWRSWIARHRID